MFLFLFIFYVGPRQLAYVVVVSRPFYLVYLFNCVLVCMYLGEVFKIKK